MAEIEALTNAMVAIPEAWAHDRNLQASPHVLAPDLYIWPFRSQLKQITTLVPVSYGIYGFCGSYLFSFLSNPC